MTQRPLRIRKIACEKFLPLLCLPWVPVASPYGTCSRVMSSKGKGCWIKGKVYLTVTTLRSKVYFTL